MSNLGAVRDIYQAFSRGDVPAIMARLAKGVEWEYGPVSTDVPWLQRRKGPEGAAAFFEALQAVSIHRFAVNRLLEDGPVVAALVDVEFTVKDTDRRVVEEDEVHLWYFDAVGKVSKFRHRVDSHQHHLAYHG